MSPGTHREGLAYLAHTNEFFPECQFEFHWEVSIELADCGPHVLQQVLCAMRWSVATKAMNIY